jgi:hypothetical protein
MAGATPYSVVVSSGTDDDEKMNGDALVFGTVDPDTVPKDEIVAPLPSQENGEEEARIPVEEKSSPFEEDPRDEQSAPSEEKEARIPVEEQSSEDARDEQSSEDARDEQSSPSEEEAGISVEEKSSPSKEDARVPVEEQGAPAKEEARIPVDEKSSPFEEDAQSPVEEQGAPAKEEARIPVDEKSSPFAQESPIPVEEQSEAEESDPSEAWTTSELGRVASRIIPHLLNLYNSTSSAHDFEAIYWPNATFEDPLMQAHGIARIKSAFYAMPKVFLDSTMLKYSMWEEETSPASGEIHIDNLQQYKLLQLGPVGYFLTMQSLIKLTVVNGKVMRHEDLWGGYRLWNRHTVWVPFVGRLAETVRWGNMLVTHILMGFGKDHKTLDKFDKDISLHLKVA